MPRAAVNPGTGLTEKQEAFCLAYVGNGGNGKKAYQQAFGSKASAAVLMNKASALLKKGEIRVRLAALRGKVEDKVVERAVVDRTYVLNGLQEVAERCLQRKPVVDRKGEAVMVETPLGEIAAAYTFEAGGANRAFELMGKEIGMFVERKEDGKPGAFRELDKLTEGELRRRAQVKAVRLGLGKVLKFDKAKRSEA